MRLVNYGVFSFVMMFAAVFAARADVDVFKELSANDVVWNSPSKDEFGSMPLGNGVTALNVWALENGEVVFYISRDDSWDENNALCKLGRIRIKISPNPFSQGAFKQELNLKDGAIYISVGSTSKIRVWVDANRQVVHVDGSSSAPVSVTATLESWRKTGREITIDKEHKEYDYYRECSQGKGIREGFSIHADTFVPSKNGVVRWYHRNIVSPHFDETFKDQKLEEFKSLAKDYISHRAFGGALEGDGFVPKGQFAITTAKPARSFHIRIHTLSKITDTPERWLGDLEQQCKKDNAVSLADAWAAHLSWWKKFWKRSWVFTHGDQRTKLVVQMYNIQRFMFACQGRGKFPIKFNGGLFVVGHATYQDKNGNEVRNPDTRLWGGCYWFQNTRFPYWAMLSSGDYDMMDPLFDMYLRMIPLLKARTKKYFNHEGIYCGETIFPWGLYSVNDYRKGWPEAGNPYIKYYWQSGVELTSMMIDRYLQTRDDEFFKKTLLPFATEVIKFYDQHYTKLDANGKRIINPAQALEMYRPAVNPTPVVEGLKAVLSRLLAVSPKLLPVATRSEWKKLLSELPPTTLVDKDGKKSFDQAKEYDPKGHNYENPEMYTVFPYRRASLGTPLYKIGLNSWGRRKQKKDFCWHQDFVQAAMLGLADQAKRYAVNRAKGKDKKSRFPAFWKAGHDWMPDQDHGGNLVLGVNRMLIQWLDNGKIYVLPAWPKDWSVAYKLYAIDRTVVEVEYLDGKVKVKTTPASKMKEVILPKWAQ